MNTPLTLIALAQRVLAPFLPSGQLTSRSGIRIDVSRNGTCSIHPADLQRLVLPGATPSPGSRP